jgi:tRNA modification GTPase
MDDPQTIAAIATPPGVSAVAIIRVSGSRAHEIARACFAPRRPNAKPTAAKLIRGWIRDPEAGIRLDEALAAYFFAPHSFTGEDLVEFHVHGGSGVVVACLALILAQGARLAAAGEFTRRACANGRMDLAQAEAVADLIAAESERAAKAAAYRLASGAGAAVAALRAELLERLVEIEAHVDYPDEVAEPERERLESCVRDQTARIAGMLAGSQEARALRDGIACVIAGPPNAGKSSLLNALLGADRAIVSAVPGTTRDVIEDKAVIDGVVVRLFDTAGLRTTHDPVEAQGVARASRAIGSAELLITVVDASLPLDAEALAFVERTSAQPGVLLANKLDLMTESEAKMAREHFAPLSRDGVRALIAGSVTWTETIAEIRRTIARLGWGGAVDANRALVANLRQIEALSRAEGALAHAAATLAQQVPIDMIASDLREAIAAYGEVTGDTVTEEVLDGIFSRFCVGK